MSRLEITVSQEKVLYAFDKGKVGDWEDYIMRRLICILFIKQQMGRACSEYKETEVYTER
jgi:hypothetical protein